MTFATAVLTLLLASVGVVRCQVADPSMHFQNVPLPEKEQQHQVLGTERVTINGRDYNVSFMNILRDGPEWREEHPYEGDTFGAVMNVNNTPVYDMADDGTFTPTIAHDPDFSSFHVTPDGTVYMVTQFERPRPGELYKVRLAQSENGNLTAVESERIDFAEWGGLWIPCAGSVTPAGTRLLGEEYEPDARSVMELTEEGLADATSEMQDIIDYMRYFGYYNEVNLTADAIKSTFNPYKYGYIVGMDLDDQGNANVSKYYALGRRSNELGYMMPDNVTVYMSDDGTNVVWHMAVLDTPHDYSSATLYAAKFTQTNSTGGGEFDIEWIKLGHATQDELAALIEANTTFFDIFDVSEPIEETESCEDGFTSINTLNGWECLSLREGMEVAAAFFEARRYSAMLGGTTEFSKWEGMTFAPELSILYIAMSDVRYGMEDNKRKGEPDLQYDIGGPNAITVEYNQCGCVYALPVEATDISEYTTVRMYPEVCGRPNTTVPENYCDVAGISNPDNIAFIPSFKVLVIGEDTGYHINNFMWDDQLGNKTELTRIFTCPFGAETTAVYWNTNINGFAYLSAVCQHPYGENDQMFRLEDEDSTGLNGWVGAIGPIPMEAIETVA
ncbi:unnamed protein product [Vitrella brassicaformis CCMP3155]|uniref:DUF839 domain-containing protein n=2 Tax=Vitrella brassicaformis TaxID=1169539 RepID=A0A0G4FC49_VITBC|nr:unnamed protein product [Vitrella brassicaformis CCMP3155]|eukprot:CEM10206.1 unnamed protein product [Vitrella brassicaformis CCMP3155]